MTNEALPAGTRLHSGAILIEELLRREEKALVYRAYDVPQRREIALLEFFPKGAQRRELAVALPLGWSTQGFLFARQKFHESTTGVLFSFEENDTLYLAQESSCALSPSLSSTPASTPTVSTPAASTRATVALTPIPPSSAVTAPAREEHLASTPPASMPVSSAPVKARPKFSWRDVVPDAMRGAVQGALAGVTGGVLLGGLASLIGDGDVMSGALRGLWALPIGALAGALLGALRALPSSAPQLATASPRTAEQQVQSTLSGAGKGALLGAFLGGAFLVFGLFSGVEISPFVLVRAIILFLLCGAFSGAIVGFIRITPRDRSRR